MPNEPTGYLALVLHAHLPFIRHPEYPDFLEEDWFFEGVVETYAPLLLRLERLRYEGLKFRLTMTVSPTLAAMLEDELLRGRLFQYLEKRIDFLHKESIGNNGNHLQHLAGHYLGEFSEVKDFIFNRHGGRLLYSLRDLQSSGHLEIITCAASHGLAPLMSGVTAWRAQVNTAVRTHETYFGTKPRGIWLAECGYEDGIDQVVAEAGLEYFYVDTHGILFGDPQPAFGPYAPVITDNGVSVFARDPESSKQVWSREEGYPGDYFYREFYRDVGYDADYEYIKPYLHSDGVRRGVGIKYHRITGKVGLGDKQFYDVHVGREKAAAHAGNFVFNRQAQVRHLRPRVKYPPILVAPYDAELFGHWWYEGPTFIEYLIRKMTFDQSDVELITGSDYLDRHPVRQIQRINPSTWGSEGYNLVWLNGANAWIYRHQHWAEKKMEEIANRYPEADGNLRRGLNQLLRELLLLQSSDWAFIISTGTTVPYATKRFRVHLDRFRQLADQIEWNKIDPGFLKYLEDTDNIYPTADYKDIYQKSDAVVEPLHSYAHS
ncbi:MAG: DUF1957 domain-containing protein [Elusimicrobia bacterium]|nr:DUF1957 domain-containing protein [Candidatus Obscuribacterium magneticum]